MIFDIVQKDHHFPPTKSRTDLNFLQNNNLSTSTAYIKINLFKLSTNFVYIVHITFYYCNYHFTERYPHGIFADGRAFVPTQGQKKKQQQHLFIEMPAKFSTNLTINRQFSFNCHVILESQSTFVK